jgi:hypothetical protein
LAGVIESWLKTEGVAGPQNDMVTPKSSKSDKYKGMVRQTLLVNLIVVKLIRTMDDDLQISPCYGRFG